LRPTGANSNRDANRIEENQFLDEPCLACGNNLDDVSNMDVGATALSGDGATAALGSVILPAGVCVSGR